jgi:uncharacterized SAM-binding protein YcdF (DUF218 family)
MPTFLLYFGIPFLLFAVFYALYRRNRASLLPSFFFTGFLIYAATEVCVLLYYSELKIARFALFLIFLVFLLVCSFGVYALILYLFLNARKVLKREGVSLSHSLTLILGVILLAGVIFVRIADHIRFPIYVRLLYSVTIAFIFLYVVHVTQYLVATLLCNLSRPRKNQDFIIVHGAWLKEGKVSPLLAGRVDKAIWFYQEQKKRATPPKLILSGGKGSDELRSEAVAMAEYAMDKGIPQSDILLEDQSETTLQNIEYSKKLMDELSGGAPYKCLYVTSNYHLLRTGIYARKTGLRTIGLGSKTALYYLPVALIREYIAYVYLYRKRNLAFAIAYAIVAALSLYWYQVYLR